MIRPLTAMAACLRLVCAMAMLVLGFAHHAPSLDARGLSASELAQYVLPDGTLPDFCLSIQEDGSGTTVKKSECVACRIGNGLVPPSRHDVDGERIAVRLKPLWPPRDLGTPDSPLAAMALPRAPPAPHPA